MKHALRTALAALITGAPAMAHERWVEHELIRPFDRALFNPANGTTLAVWAAAITLLAFAVAAGRRAPSTRLRAPARLRDAGACALRVALGATLVLFSLEGRFIAPDLVVSAGPAGAALLVAATGLGLLLALGIQTPRVAALLVLAFVAATVARPFEDFDGAGVRAMDVLAYSGALGMAGYLGLRAAARQQPRPLCVVTYRSAAVGALRLALGLNLVLLGVTKYLQPELFVAVAQNYPALFQDPFRPLGPEAVTLAASTVECGLGLLLVIGTWPRLVGLGLLGVFASTTFVLEGELIGHLPLIATALVLTLEEPGRLTDLGRVLRALVLPSYRPVPERCETRGRLAFVPLVLVVGTLAILVPTSTGSAGAPAPATLRADATWAEVEGEDGAYRFELDVDAAGFEVQEFFTIATRVRDARSGRPLDGFELVVDVTMPHHFHGMLTAPRTAREGRGLFRTSGCKLHMPGTWQVSLELSHAGVVVDRAALPLIVVAPHAR